MADEKDRFGEKIHQSEKAREDQWARSSDAELPRENPPEERAGGLPCIVRSAGSPGHRGSDGIGNPRLSTGEGAWIEASVLDNLLKK